MHPDKKEICLSDFFDRCRACESKEKYANLLDNKELLKNLSSLVQAQITDFDGFSKWLCGNCVEKVEDFTKFVNKYRETSRKLALLKYEPPSPCLREQGNFVETFDNSPHLSDTDELSPIASSEDLDDDNLYSSENVNSNENLIIKRNVIFQCDICSKSYSSRKILQRHVKTFHEMMKVTCSICEARFNQKAFLDEHERKYHKTEMIPRQVSSGTELTSFAIENTEVNVVETEDKSIRKSHNEKKKYRKQCSVCGLFFKHIEEHSLKHQNKNSFRCQHPGCKKTFKFNTSLQVHLRIHSNERKFECNICSKKFRVSHHLKEHLTIHSTEKDFVCDICSKKFSSKLNLYKHSKLHLKKSKICGQL